MFFCDFPYYRKIKKALKKNGKMKKKKKFRATQLIVLILKRGHRVSIFCHYAECCFFVLCRVSLCLVQESLAKRWKPQYSRSCTVSISFLYWNFNHLLQKRLLLMVPRGKGDIFFKLKSEEKFVTFYNI